MRSGGERWIIMDGNGTMESIVLDGAGALIALVRGGALNIGSTV